MNDAKYIGLDVHQATISVAVLDSAGKLVMEAILETKAETILQFIRGLRGSEIRGVRRARYDNEKQHYDRRRGENSLVQGHRGKYSGDQPTSVNRTGHRSFTGFLQSHDAGESGS